MLPLPLLGCHPPIAALGLLYTFGTLAGPAVTDAQTQGTRQTSQGWDRRPVRAAALSTHVRDHVGSSSQNRVCLWTSAAAIPPRHQTQDARSHETTPQPAQRSHLAHPSPKEGLGTWPCSRPPSPHSATPSPLFWTGGLGTWCIEVPATSGGQERSPMVQTGTRSAANVGSSVAFHVYQACVAPTPSSPRPTPCTPPSQDSRRCTFLSTFGVVFFNLLKKNPFYNKTS